MSKWSLCDRLIKQLKIRLYEYEGFDLVKRIWVAGHVLEFEVEKPGSELSYVLIPTCIFYRYLR